MKKITLISCILLWSSNVFSQSIIGKVTNINNIPIEDVNISTKNGIGCSTDKQGNYILDLSKGNHMINFQHISFSEKEINIKLSRGKKILNVTLLEKTNMLSDVEIDSKKEDHNISQILSLDVINEDFFLEKSNTDISGIVNQISGLTLNDKQVHIRGGSGWNPMAGSRVLFLINDNPLLTGNMGQIPWDLIPMENIEEIEIIKGASSAIYGPSALNGVVNIKTKSANRKLIDKHPSQGYTQVNSLYGYYNSPNRKELVWWEGKNEFINFDLLHTEIFNNTSISISGNYFKDDGYRMGQNILRKRVSSNIRHHSQKIDGLELGINGTYMQKEDGMFLLWESFENGYIPLDSNLYRKHSQLYQISPYISLKTNKGEHLLKTQFLDIALDYNPADNMRDNDISSRIYYLDYNYKKQIDRIKSNIIIGSSSKTTFANADVFSGTNYVNTNSIYTLLEKKTNKTTLSLGSRYEMVRMVSEEKFSYAGEDSANKFSINFPVFYAGINHKINNNNSLRTYLGQGVRFPTIAEMFVSTDALEGTSIFPNSSLKPESGWSFELGYNIGYKRTNLEWNLDLSYFLMRYEDMMEFGFEQFGTEFDEDHAFGLGFKTINVGSTQISGVETELESEFNINPKTTANIILGYTYMNPIALNPEEVYAEIKIGDSIAGYISNYISFLNSSSDPTILKYRYQHLLKMDARFEYERYSFGINLNYNDYMKNIDKYFTTELVNEGVYYQDTIQVFAPIIPGINKSREMNKKGDLLIDLSIGVRINSIAKLNFIINNATNAEIYTRPTDLLSPRRYSIKLKITI